MVQINLLPDLRQAKIRDQHRRHLAVAGGVGVCVAVAAVVVILLGLRAAQLIQISVINGQIKTRQTQLQATSHLVPALTAQQTLNTLPGLYAQRTYYTQLLTVIASLQPASLQVASIQESGANSLDISGTASSYTAVATFAQALSTGNATTKQYSGTQSPFSSVTITSTSENQSLTRFPSR